MIQKPVQAGSVAEPAVKTIYPVPFSAQGHQLVNRTAVRVAYLEIGDRAPGDLAEYPNDDVMFTRLPDGKTILTHKDGRPY
jgi:uncharacterized cupin superfamily protein